MVFKVPHRFVQVQYFRAPLADEEEEGFLGGLGKPGRFSGGGGAAVESVAVEISPLRALLDLAVDAPASAEALGSRLSERVNAVVARALREEGHALSHWTPQPPLLEASYDRARAGLAGLMAGVREALVATISRRGSVEDAVALVDWRALELVLDLAEKGLSDTRRFGDLCSDSVEQETAAAIAALDIHRPLPHRQSAAERRALRAALADGA